MDIQNVGKIIQTGLEGTEAVGGGQDKAVGKTSDFEKVRMDKLEQEEQVTGLKASDIQYNDNILNRMDARQVQNDFLRQVQARGEGKELEVLSEHIQKTQASLEKTRATLPAVDKSEFSGAVQNYFKESETRFKALDSMYQEISSGDRPHSLQDLLKMQMQIQGISQNIEMLSKVVDKVVDGMKTILRTQV